MESFARLSGSKPGKDKVLRLIQYCLRAHNAGVEAKETGSDTPDLKGLESSFSGARHAFRLFSFVESYRSLSCCDPADVLQFLRLAEDFAFTWTDTISYLAKHNFIFPRKTHAKWVTLTNLLWMSGCILGLLRACRIGRARASENAKVEDRIRLNLDVGLEVVKNFLDLILPMKALGIMVPPLSDRASAICGIISSICGIVALVEPSLKIA